MNQTPDSPLNLPEGYQILKIEDKPIFDIYFGQYPPSISELSFTNLFMWRNHYQFAWIEHNNGLYVRSTNASKFLDYWPLIGEYNEQTATIGFLKGDSLNEKKNVKIHRAPEGLKEWLENNISNVNCKEDRANWDYIYTSEDLADLPGQEYRNIRRKLNSFIKENNWEYYSFEPRWIEACLDLQEEWCNIRDCEEHDGLRAEDQAIKDALQNWDILQFQGGVVLVEDKIVAFCLAEPLNDSTMVVHIEKASPDYTGSYQIINQAFANSIRERYKFINREQDLGIKGLRTAKQRYHPTKMAKKYTLTLSFS